MYTYTVDFGGNEDLVSVTARVRNSWVQEKKIVFSINLRNNMEKSHKPCSFDNSLLVLTMDHKRLKIIRL